MKQSVWRGIQWALTAWVAVLIPTYWYYYGPQNFLWGSDIGLFCTVLALWLRSPLLMSIPLVGIVVLEVMWCVNFAAQLMMQMQMTAVTSYMFDSSLPLLVRLLSLFHVVTPVVWLLYAKQYGYHRKAPRYFVPIFWAVLGATYFTHASENINGVFGFQSYHIAPAMWLLLLALAYPLCVVLPTHYLLKKFFKPVS